jgi:hypothetical protein
MRKNAIVLDGLTTHGVPNRNIAISIVLLTLLSTYLFRTKTSNRHIDDRHRNCDVCLYRIASHSTLRSAGASGTRQRRPHRRRRTRTPDVIVSRQSRCCWCLLFLLSSSSVYRLDFAVLDCLNCSPRFLDHCSSIRQRRSRRAVCRFVSLKSLFVFRT